MKYGHGRRAAYVLDKCRCERCTAANRAYARLRWRIAQGYDEGTTTAAGPTRARLEELFAAGYTRRTICAVTGLTPSTIDGIRGKRNARQSPAGWVRITTAEAIEFFEFDLDYAALPPYYLVPVAPFLVMVDDLLAAGWTKAAIATALAGKPTPSLQSARANQKRIRASTAATLNRIWTKATAEAPTRRGGATKQRIVDLLEDCGPLGRLGLIAEMQARWDYNERTVSKSLFNLAREGRVQRVGERYAVA